MTYNLHSIYDQNPIILLPASSAIFDWFKAWTSKFMQSLINLTEASSAFLHSEKVSVHVFFAAFMSFAILSMVWIHLGLRAFIPSTVPCKVIQQIHWFAPLVDNFLHSSVPFFIFVISVLHFSIAVICASSGFTRVHLSAISAEQFDKNL